MDSSVNIFVHNMDLENEKNAEAIPNCCVQLLQFLCLKNIRTFLTSCCEMFGMKKSDLFEAFDLFDVRDFGKVFIILFIYHNMMK